MQKKNSYILTKKIAVHWSIFCCFDTEKQAWHPKTNTWDMLEWSLLLKESLEST